MRDTSIERYACARAPLLRWRQREYRTIFFDLFRVLSATSYFLLYAPAIAAAPPALQRAHQRGGAVGAIASSVMNPSARHAPIGVRSISFGRAARPLRPTAGKSTVA